MASEITLPVLGENLKEGEVLEVKVAAGDTVQAGQALLEIEADKSTVEVPAPQAGRVEKVLVQKGDKVTVGQPLFFIKEDDGQQSAVGSQQSAVSSRQPEPAPDHSPLPTPQVTRGALLSTSPTVHHVTHGAPLTKLVPAGPATRQLARELGIDLNQVTGKGPSGRVTQEDVKAYVRQLAAGTAGRGPATQAPSLPDFERWGPVERKALEAVRRKTAEQMSLAWNLIPHVTQHDQADITDLDAFRRQQEPRVTANGPKLTVTAFALKAAAVALKQFPHFNSSLDAAAGQLVLKHYYHIGVAVDAGRGLLVPVLRDVDKKSVRELALELADVAERARQKKVPVEDMRGGTFTITNLGGIGGTAFTPLVNYPEVAILGLSRSRLLPVVHNGQIVPRLILPLSLSYDHRVIDGADAARFTRRLAEMFENPLLMLL